MSAPRTINSTTLQRQPGETLWSVSNGKETFIITDHKRTVAVLLPVEQYESLMAAQRHVDALLVAEAIAKGGP